LFREGTPCFAAFHRVKYVDMPAADNVVQDFEQIGVCIETDKQMLIILSRYRMVEDIVRKGIANIGLGNAVSESRLIKLDTSIHAFFNYSMKKAAGKEPCSEGQRIESRGK
jgi:hypothetical protein